MFIPFFYRLKAEGVPVTTGEFLDFLKVVDHYTTNKKAWIDLNELYRFSRACMVKDVKYFDAFDLVFSEVFGEKGALNLPLRDELMQWLENIFKNQNPLPPSLIPPEQLLDELKKRLEEQKGEHHGGRKWVGTGGSSPFGHSGTNPEGVRVGGDGGNRSAVFQAMERRYKEYRTDEQLDVRQIKTALKKLRNLRKEGTSEFHLAKTIDSTCRNAGDIQIEFERSRKNGLKILLLMDTGGSMTGHAERVNKLFSAAHQINHFKEFHHYYFHNVIYDAVYPKANLRTPLSLAKLFKKHADDTKLILIGDAYMAPYELLDPTYGFYHSRFRTDFRVPENPESGLDSLKRIRRHFRDSVWLNPEPLRYWDAPTIREIGAHVPMYFLSLDGLEKSIKKLLNSL
ncbi:VWA containing CoxE family protein [Leptospira ellisii]|uniref:VWA containing CoxE family protein n=1 Tax=Leptospira ellisii TaxID=2023197 RepID=A0A2N0B9H5_9LEPT|nr:VWA containing CoxE family protein [Leptospira ellisii]MDV6235061.1 VWA containing CoxE family protein [Leptospira ellisii]PJZ93169.1 VWA containing CoxE family protein [Leptospira ellisii]